MKRFLFLAILAAGAFAPASAQAVAHCGRSTINYPDGNASLVVDIRATHISCTSARRVVRSCQHGHVRRGWRTRSLPNSRLLMTSGRRRINFRILGVSC